MLVNIPVHNNPICAMIAKINGNTTKIKQLADGIYEIGHFSFDSCMPFRITFEEQYPALSGCSYGVCDHFEQILEVYPELQDPNRRFCISVTPILRKNQPSEGGWRWCKWGNYIGEHKPQHEYLYDEKIDGVLVYHIYEFNADRIL